MNKPVLLPVRPLPARDEGPLDVFADVPGRLIQVLDLPDVMLQPYQSSGTAVTPKDMGPVMRGCAPAHFCYRPLSNPVI